MNATLELRAPQAFLFDKPYVESYLNDQHLEVPCFEVSAVRVGYKAGRLEKEFKEIIILREKKEQMEID